MILSLDPELQKLIEERIKSGKYESAEEVIRAAVISLEAQERFGDFHSGELDALLEEGERSLVNEPPIVAKDDFAHFRTRAEARRNQSE